MGTRDPQGPDHKPETISILEIEGVLIQKSPFVNYAHGALTELYRPEWIGVFAQDEPIEHLYTVYAPQGGMRKEWYYHEHTLDRYMVVLGGLDVGLYDGRKDSKTFGNFMVVSLVAHSEELPNGIRIPPGVWHSLRWSTTEGIILNAKLPKFNPKLVDKFRVPLEDLPDSITWNLPES